jgi:hypothetical protein
MTGSIWTADELDRIGGAGEIQIAPPRADSTLRRAVAIWVVRMATTSRPLLARRRRQLVSHFARDAQGHISARGVDLDVSLADVGETSTRWMPPTGTSRAATPATSSR